MIVSVGFLSAFEQNGPPSVMKRFFTSQVWHHWLVTDFLRSAPMIVPPTSWMILPPGSIAFAPSASGLDRTLPPIAAEAEAVEAQCDTLCWTPCDTRIPAWAPPDPDSPSAWDLVPTQVLDPARRLLETCELHRRACHACLDRLREFGVTR